MSFSQHRILNFCVRIKYNNRCRSASNARALRYLASVKKRLNLPWHVKDTHTHAHSHNTHTITHTLTYTHKWQTHTHTHTFSWSNKHRFISCPVIRTFIITKCFGTRIFDRFFNREPLLLWTQNFEKLICKNQWRTLKSWIGRFDV